MDWKMVVLLTSNVYLIIICAKGYVEVWKTRKSATKKEMNLGVAINVGGLLMGLYLLLNNMLRLIFNV